MSLHAWSTPGIRLVYASEHLSLAMIEYFVHLDRDDPPPDLLVAAADVPDDVSRVTVSSGSLPTSWRQTPAPPELAAIGDRFARKRRDAILIVPSALAPDEANWLLNPGHLDFTRIRVQPPEPFTYDTRFFA